MTDFTFELDAGRTCLDFVNTLDSSGDHLASYADLVAFAAQSHLLTREDATWLREEGERDRVGADGVLLRATRLRASLYAIFSALARGKTPRDYDVEQLNFELAATLTHSRVLHAGAASEPTYRWGWAGRNMDAPLWGISRSAADLLTNAHDVALVRECGGTDCRWLFLDTSKNRTRQWCSMKSCGNRQKARRHYDRRRAPRPATPDVVSAEQTVAQPVSNRQNSEQR